MSIPDAERVQLIKWESTSEGGGEDDTFPTGINSKEDAIEARGYYGQPFDGPVDEDVWIARDGDDWKFRDKTVTTAKKLSELVGGITEGEHESLDTLVHDIDETSYDEVTYSGSQVTSYIVWDSASKTKKVREETYSYSGSKISQIVTKQYDGTGTLKMTMTEDYTYSGSRVTSITRTKS